jgi:lysozyme
MLYKNQALELLREHEGYRQFPYADSLGIQTIGYGRNLESRGISEPEASYLLSNDIAEAEEMLHSYGYYFNLSGERKAVLIDMMVNMGPTRLAGFKKMHAALEDRDYELAALEMLDSKWSTQVGQRSLTLSKVMHDNKI